MDRGWSQSMPTERIVLSISQRCSVQRRVGGPPEAGADDRLADPTPDCEAPGFGSLTSSSEPSGMVSPPSELAAGHRDYNKMGGGNRPRPSVRSPVWGGSGGRGG